MAIADALLVIRDLFGGGTLDPADEAMLRAQLQNEEARGQAYELAQTAYWGDLPPTFRPEAGEPDHNIRVNRVGPVVDASVFYLFGDLPTWEIPAAEDGEGDPDTPSPAETLLTECLRLSDWPVVALDWAHNGSLDGTAFLRIYLPTAPLPRGAPPTLPEHFPTVQTLDPGCTTILYNPRNTRDVRGYKWQYVTSDGQGRTRVDRQLVRVQEDGTWLITDQYCIGGGPWITEYEETWPYPWCPILHCKNLPNPNRVYGSPDVTEALVDLNVVQNRIYSNRAKILWHHSHPQIVAYGMGAMSLQWGPGHVLVAPGPDTKIEQIAPAISGEEAASLGRELFEAGTEQSATPSVVLGRDDQAGDPSGIALQIKFGPLKRKIIVKRLLYGPAIVELYRRLLHVLTGRPDLVVGLKWREIVPINLLEERKLLQLDQLMGVASKQTIADKLGYKYAEERANLEQEGPINVAANVGGQALAGHAGGQAAQGEPPAPPAGQAPGQAG